MIRAELPGLNPAKDIEVTLDGRTLTIHAERSQHDDERYRTEFRYGPVTLSVRLCARVNATRAHGSVSASFASRPEPGVGGHWNLPAGGHSEPPRGGQSDYGM